ncbi:MAG TPA: RcnB family protein [Rhizomicrobium sp.]|nr:RcnB family protein [Rhizomicrobium sp.]
MKLKFLFAGVVLASGALAAAQAAPLVLAQNDQHHEEHKAPPPGGGQPHGAPPPQHGHPGAPPHGNMSGPPHGGSMMGPSHNAMMGHKPPPNRNFDRHAYQRNFVAPRRFHAAVYVRPQGWYEHRWVFGEILPALFWSQNYWLSDYYDYGLAEPPPGFVWVRYGSDALLIDQNSGEVLQVEYDVFY